MGDHGCFSMTQFDRTTNSKGEEVKSLKRVESMNWLALSAAASLRHEDENKDGGRSGDYC